MTILLTVLAPRFLASPSGRLDFSLVGPFEFYGTPFARWLQAQNEGRPVRYEKVEPGDEQILPEQRDLDALASGLDRELEY